MVVTFYFRELDGATIINEPIYGNSDHTTVLNAFQTYEGYAQVTNDYGQAGIKLYWESSSFAQTLVATESFGYTEDIASSPYQITVICAEGYTQVGND